MPLPLMTFACHACGYMEMVEIGTLQLIGSEPWFNANGWRVHRVRPRTVRCQTCWDADPLAPDDDVERVRSGVGSTADIEEEELSP